LLDASDFNLININIGIINAMAYPKLAIATPLSFQIFPKININKIVMLPPIIEQKLFIKGIPMPLAIKKEGLAIVKRQ
jgi:hypothetical protein